MALPHDFLATGANLSHLINNETDCGRVVLYAWIYIFTYTKVRPVFT